MQQQEFNPKGAIYHLEQLLRLYVGDDGQAADFRALVLIDVRQAGAPRRERGGSE